MRAVIFAVVVLGLSVAQAQPSDTDLAKASELYKAATQAMEESRFTDAARDFTAAYEISGDPVVLFKIGSAYQKAGDCTKAVEAFNRYLDEGKPDAEYAKLTQERIDACAPTPPAPPPEPTPPPPEPMQPPPAPPEPTITPSRNKDIAWLLVGGALTFATAGTVLAYSTGSAEQDIRDLYTSLSGAPATYDDMTRKQYEALMREGERYERLSWTAFGIAGGCAIGAAIFFYRASREEPPPAVTPVVTPTSAGVSMRF